MEGEHTLRFVQPWLLLLLLALGAPLAYWWLRGRRTVRNAVALGIRVLVLALLIVALSRPQTTLEVRRLAVSFTLDISESVPDSQRASALAWVREKIGATPADDDAALIVFGDRPSLEVPYVGGGRRGEAGNFELAAVQSRLSRAHSNLAGAASFSESTFPPGFARRIVLISDGNETRGDLLTAARALKAAGVQLDVVPLKFASEQEARVDGLRAPQNVVINQPFTLRLTVTAQTATNATLQLYENAAPAGEALKVRLENGLNVFKLTRELSQAGYYQYEVHVNAERDGNPANNIGRASVLVAGQARVLVCSPAGWQDHLSPALTHGGIAAWPCAPRELARHPAGYADCDCLVLNNVAAFDLSEPQIGAIDHAVRNLGMGLVVVGGDKSYGPGGYRGTLIEKLLPVDLDIKNRKNLPKGALVIVLHSIEFDTGNTWAERICKSALGGLQETDDAGIVYYDHASGEQWLFELAPLGSRVKQYSLIENVRVGDMPSFHNCFKLAWASLQKNDAAIKHVVVISDGDPQRPGDSLLQEIVAGKVTVSTICINPHGPQDKVAMKTLADDGGGRFYSVDMGDDLNRLPSLMLKEAATLRRAAINEKTFTPGASIPDSPMLRGIRALPPLHGYVVTAPRREAETILVSDDKEDPDPILATWLAGLGRCTAFTSDVSTRWANDWLAWSGFEAFWLQVLRATRSSTGEGKLPLQVEVHGSTVKIAVDARDAEGSARTNLAFDALLLGEGESEQRLAFTQQSPGRYESGVEGLEQGHYLLRVLDREGKAQTSLAVFSVDFSEEHRALQSNEALLQEAAELTGGRVLQLGDDPFSHDLKSTLDARELWPWLLLAAATLLVVDVAVRRLEFGRAIKQRKSAAKIAATVAKPPIAAQPEARAPEKPASAPAAPKIETKTEAAPLDQLLKAKKRAEDKRKWQ
jgi:uncharacterized membrane protein